MNALSVFYSIKPLMPRKMQIFLRRVIAKRQRRAAMGDWPIDYRAAGVPAGWAGWPEGRRFALILYHDVDSVQGLKNCSQLMELEKRLEFRSSFFFVPGDYDVPRDLRETLVHEGFEIGIHGFRHDGRTFSSRKIFNQRASKINQFLKDWGAVGYSSPSTLRKLDWIAELDIEYDCSTFDTDPFEPQPNGTGTIFPFPVRGPSNPAKFIEIPYTLPQDHSLFIVLKERTIGVWKEKVDWIAEHGGVAVLNTHPDYMNFNGSRYSHKGYPARNYSDFLEYVKAKYAGRYWHVLPRKLADFWRRFLRDNMKTSDAEGRGPGWEPASMLDRTSSKGN